LSRPYPAADDWQATCDAAANQLNPWVVLAGYHFDLEYQQRIKQAGFKLAVIDDIASLPHYCTDVLINQNIYAEDLTYSCEPYTRRLLGTRYAMLREELSAHRRTGRPVRTQARRILIMMGGSDPQNATVKVLTALRDVQLPALEVRVLVGAANPRLEEIRDLASSLRFPVELVVAMTRVAEHLAWAEVAIAAAGTSAIELAFMGVPTLLMVAAKNQAPIAAKLDALGAARNLAWVSRITAARIRADLWDLLDAPQIRAAMGRAGSAPG
jgi:UDP-2,4-diacetamido-2,4,6-trideoxy-beta-L-altropyranose hydrolase